jgi:hypothetical protein
MIIKCPHCKVLLPVPDASFKIGLPKLTCPQCKTSFVPEIQNGKSLVGSTDVIVQKPVESIAWLIVHDEQAPVQTFDIVRGNYVIGRKSASRPCAIMVETNDMTMSRNHFIIEAMPGKEESLYKLSDFQSTNNTFVNEKSLQEASMKNNGKYTLRDGDIIQAGKTKIEFRIKSADIKSVLEATKIITRRGYAKTVLLNKYDK